MEPLSPNPSPFSGPPPQMFPGVPNVPTHKSHIVLLVVIIALALGLGVGVYAFVQKYGLFAKPLYTEENFLSGLLEKSTQIDSMSSTFAASLAVVPRDSDAVPFTVQNTNEGELREKYQNDAARAKSVAEILTALKNTYGARTVYNAAQRKYIPQAEKPFPVSLDKLVLDVQRKPALLVVDPITNKKYEYKTTENNKNFTLTVEFETQSAISSLRRYNSGDVATLVEGRTVTFTKDSSPYLYLSSEPPKPFLVQLGEYARYLPPDIDVDIALAIASNLKTEDLADWSFNLDAKGDLGDLSYAVNIDALKKESDYFFKINKLPSLFLGSLASIKGQWIKVSAATSTEKTLSGRYNEFSAISREFPEYEKKYREARKETFAVLKAIAMIADQERVILFKKNPRKETILGRDLTRYDLGFRKEAIVPFYMKLLEEVKKSRKNPLSQIAADQGVLEYLQSKEFEEVFDYIDKNLSQTVWVDQNGFLAMVEHAFRVVPGDTATQLKDKQVRLNFRNVFEGINEPVRIEAPKDAKPIETLIDETDKNFPGSGAGVTATTKAHLSSLRAQAEIVYDTNGGYGKKVFPVGACKQTVGTLFADATIYKYIKDAAAGDASKATCATALKNGKIESYAVSVPLVNLGNYSWCVDSLGTSKQITGAIKAFVCN